MIDYRDILDSMDLGIVTVDLQGEVTSCNRALEEILEVTGALKHLSWGKEVAVITDGRFSGVSTGACIGHIAPEALAGGPVGKVREGDMIQIIGHIDLPKFLMDLYLEVHPYHLAA